MEFEVAPSGNIKPLKFETSTRILGCKVATFSFQYVAVTGNVGKSLKIELNDKTYYSMAPANRWGDVTTLPAPKDGPLIFGSNSKKQLSKKIQTFNGQMAYIRIFEKERTDDQILRSINAPYADNGAPVGSWHLRQSKEVHLIHYVISSLDQISAVKVLEQFDPPSSSFPVFAFERNKNIYLFRLTAHNDLVAKIYKLSSDKRTLPATSLKHTNVNTGSQKAEKGCFTVAHDTVNKRVIVLTCKESTINPIEVIFTWKVFKISADGNLLGMDQKRSKDSIRVAGTRLDTRPSPSVVGSHLLLTAGAIYKARILFLDLKLDKNVFPEVSVGLVVPLSIGPNIIHAGISYYSYLYKPAGYGGSNPTKQMFLRRLRPQAGGHATSYSIQESRVDPKKLTAQSTITSDMPENDSFWFLFKISSLACGNVIESGQRILIETPDSNPKNKRKWHTVSSDGKTLIADNNIHFWRFWIFKTKTCDPQNIKVLRGTIEPDDCILIWPKVLQFGPNCFCSNVLAFPAAKQIQGARQSFGSWFGPWRLMIPMHDTPVRPIPHLKSPKSAVSSPTTVYQGNKYALLHFGTQGINVLPQSGTWAALLRFARTTMAPLVVTKTGSTPPAKILFRGNGGPLPLNGGFREKAVNMKAVFKTVYREGSFAQSE